jgi:nicotinamidase-related amidase
MARQVVVVVDLQNDYFPGGKLPLWNVEAARDNAARVIAGARAAGNPVIHVQHEFPDANAPFFVAGTDGVLIHESVRPEPGEEVVVKHHANSFRDTRLREVLDGHAPEEVVIVGAMSHLCIDATTRAAADQGYNVVVIHDACATIDLGFGGQAVPAPQVHAAFMAALSSGYARLQSADEHLDERVAA